MRSTEIGIRDFKSSSGWLDIKDIVEERIESVRDILESEANADTLHFHQGRVQELKLFLDFPEIILEELIDNRGDKDAN